MSYLTVVSHFTEPLTALRALHPLYLCVHIHAHTHTQRTDTALVDHTIHLSVPFHRAIP